MIMKVSDVSLMHTSSSKMLPEFFQFFVKMEKKKIFTTIIKQFW